MFNRGSVPVFFNFYKTRDTNVKGLEIDEKWKCLKSANYV